MQTNGLRVLLNHYEGKPTYVFKLSDSIDDIVVSNGCQTFRIDEMYEVFDEYDVSSEQEHLVKGAIESLKDDTPLTLEELFNICKMFRFFDTFTIINILPNPYDTLKLYQRCVVTTNTIKLCYEDVEHITERILKVGDEGLDVNNIEQLDSVIDNIIMMSDFNHTTILKIFTTLFHNTSVKSAEDHVKKRLKMYIDSLIFPIPAMRDFIDNNLSGIFLIGTLLLEYKGQYAFDNTVSYLKYNLSECSLNTLPKELSDIIRNYKPE